MWIGGLYRPVRHDPPRPQANQMMTTMAKKDRKEHRLARGTASDVALIILAQITQNRLTDITSTAKARDSGYSGRGRNNSKMPTPLPDRLKKRSGALACESASKAF